jgi:hypothetical protein
MSSATIKPSARLLGTLRDVLFEAAPPAAPASSAAVSEGASTGELGAARAALEQGLAEQLGSGVRELSLQMAGLSEVLLDTRQRQRAALKVLALKGISTPALLLELEQALGALASQHEAFASKLRARRAALDEQRVAAASACEAESQSAEQAMQRLQAELETERAKLAEAAERRRRALALCDETAAKLSATELGFERAFLEISGEYSALKAGLSGTESV